MPDSFEYREMQISDYPDILKEWESDKNIYINEADSKEGINNYLSRNENMSTICTYKNSIIGTILTGDDGRYGYLHHLYVNESHQNKGIGSELIRISIEKLKNKGFKKVFLQIFKNNEDGKKYWMKKSWNLRDDIDLMDLNLT
jgi:ribosomal protein S18 acetylase RimI-like enzyme